MIELPNNYIYRWQYEHCLYFFMYTLRKKEKLTLSFENHRTPENKLNQNSLFFSRKGWIFLKERLNKFSDDKTRVFQYRSGLKIVNSS